jgi:hypothetical protein
MRDRRLILVAAAAAILLWILVKFGPALFGGTIAFVDSPRLGHYVTVRSPASAVFACLLAGLVIFAIYKRRRNTEKFGDKERSLWICPKCHEENPGNFGECWKCMRMRDESAQEK